MLSDFSKLETFLTVVREKSFSKASIKLGISQPAVTQQIRFIENYLDVQIVDRKKNGIRLTKEGQMLYAVALKLEKSVSNAKKDLLKIMNKNISFVFGTSFIIGNYILPKFLSSLQNNVSKEISINVSVSENSIEQLLDKQIDIALVENILPSDDIIYQEWMEDEIVMFSNQKLPEKSQAKDLMFYRWICRGKDSKIKAFFKNFLENINYPDCDSFNITSEISDSTTIIQTVLYSDKTKSPTVSIVSRNAIVSLLKSKALYESRLENHKMVRKLYIAYRKDKKDDEFVKKVIKYLLDTKK